MEHNPDIFWLSPLWTSFSLFFYILVCCLWVFSLLHMSTYTIHQHRELKQKAGFVFRGLQKLQGILSEMCQLLHTSNMSLSSHIFSHWLDIWTYTSTFIQPPISADDWGTRAAILECTLCLLPSCLSERKDYDRVAQGVRGDTNTMSVVRYGWHFKMTGLLFTERNVDIGLSSAAFLTVWKWAREGWWQADSLSVVSAPSNLLAHTTRYRTCLCDWSLLYICSR